MIPASERAKTVHTLDRSATVTDEYTRMRTTINKRAHKTFNLCLTLINENEGELEKQKATQDLRCRNVPFFTNNFDASEYGEDRDS
jgi:hypothetical protein